ncbi:MAG: hypothetical protein AAGB26_06300 [Planctomycetota bacterium]
MIDPPSPDESFSGPQGFENEATPINKKRGFPWKKVIIGSFLLMLVYAGWSAMTPDPDSKDTNQNASKPSKQQRPLPFLAQSNDEEFDAVPRLVYIMGDEATFEYNGAHYRLPNGNGPIGGDWFCSLLDGRGVATIHDAAGTTYYLGVDRTYSSDIRRNSGSASRSVSGEVRPPR